MSRYADLPYVQGRNYGPTRTRTQMIVIHATANTASAEAEASYASRRTDGVSSHFYTDGDSTVQSLDTKVVAYGCHPTGNSRSVQFELCGPSGGISDATMRQAAPIVARACNEYGIPIRKITPEQLRAGVLGICGHRDVTQAWHEGDHTDPEPFPWATFIGYVQAADGGGEDEDMPTGMGPIQLPRAPHAHESYSIWPVNSGAIPWGVAFASIFADLFGGKAAFRIALSDGAGKWTIVGEKIVVESGKIWNMQLPTGCRGISVIRVPSDETDPCAGSVSMSIEYGRR